MLSKQIMEFRLFVKTIKEELISPNNYSVTMPLIKSVFQEGL
jgi:hypothetical protein